MRILQSLGCRAGLALFVLASSARAEEPVGRKYLLERVDDAAVVQLYADGFKDLPLKQKLLTWHLYQASIAGRDIYYDQRHVKGLPIRGLMEAIIAHPEGVNPKTLAEVQRYTKLVWINSGFYNNLTARKFVLYCTPAALEAALQTAVVNGAKLDFLGVAGDRLTIHQLVDSYSPYLFNADFQPIVTNKNPGPGRDILASSANNLYKNVTMADLKGFTERYPSNSALWKDKEGRLQEMAYRVGDMYDGPIRRIVAHLNEARKYAEPPTDLALQALIKFYTTGEEADRRAYDIAWVRDKDAQVDTINGFIEVYMDPRGVKASWESAVFFVNKEKTGNIKKLAASAQWFEDHMPWETKYRKENVKGITANAIDVVIETGDCGPVTPIGINLPNDQKVREQFGSKSVSLSNVIEASDKSTPTSFRAEFAWTPEEVTRAEKWGTLAQELLVNMHEVIGHASGKLSEKVHGEPQKALKQFYSALEEGRADLVALYYMPDPKLAELGLIAAESQADLARTAYEQYARNAMVQLRRVREGTQLEEDHMRNRQMVVNWLIANTPAVDVLKRDGKTYYVMTDPKAFREGVATLLAEIQRIKAEGDFEAAKTLFETHGIRFDPKLRDEVVTRVAKLNIPAYTGYVMPRLTPVKGPDGAITDVAISYPMDLTTQMLEYAKASR